MVCLHGVTGHGARFRKLAEERLASRFRVLAPDLRGHGRSDWEPPWDLDAHVEDLLSLPVERAAWIGHSFGGRLVLELVARHPERVAGAVLLDPAVWVPPPVALARAEDARPVRSFASVEEAIEHRVAASRLLHTPPDLVAQDMAEHLVPDEDGRLRYRYCPSAVVAAYGELAKPPPLDRLAVPALLVHGVETDVLPAPLLEACRGSLGERLAVVAVPGGHHVLWDAFPAAADAIEAFLDSWVGGP